MVALREYMQVIDNQLIINLPKDFNYKEVEVVIMPKDNQDLSHFNDEIKKGLESSISQNSHNEIFDRLKTKYAQN
jgi:hypothetical protein